MHGIGEIHRRGAARKRLDLAARGKDVDFLWKHVHLDRFHELDGVLEVLLPLHQPSQPGKILVALFARSLLLVMPMRRDAFFRRAVHLLGADLQLDALALGTQHGGMQGLVHVGFRQGDVVFEASGNGFPEGMDDTQDGIAVAHGVGDDPNGQQVVDFLERQLLALHLLVNAVVMLRPSGKPATDVHLREFLGYGFLHLRQVAFARVRLARELGLDVPERPRMQIEEGKVFQLGLHPGNAEPVGQRGVDFQRFAGDQALLVARHVLQGAQVVQPVGELDQNHPDVLGHGDQHLAETLRLPLFLAEELELAQLGDTGDERGDLGAEGRCDLFLAGVRIFDGVVKQRAGDGHGVHLQLGQNGRDRQGM